MNEYATDMKEILFYLGITLAVGFIFLVLLLGHLMMLLGGFYHAAFDSIGRFMSYLFGPLARIRRNRLQMPHRMRELCCLIIKCDYLYHHCNNQALAEDKYKELRKELSFLEERYPVYKLSFSPISSPQKSFVELGKDAYGENWTMIQNTWDLLKLEPPRECDCACEG